jgi:uncharacterized membrane protein HdeD (DUF308 family)
MLDIYIGITLLVIGIILIASLVKMEAKDGVARVALVQRIVAGLLLIAFGIMFLSGLSHYEPKQKKNKEELCIPISALLLA